MLALHEKLAAATVPPDKELYQRQIEATDRQIDRLVYELYGLTEEEIEIVEDATGDRRVKNPSIRLTTRRGAIVHLGFSGRKSPHNYR